MSFVNEASAYRFAKLALLDCNTGSFRTQNWQFWNAELAVLENDTNCIGKQTAVSSISESILSAYHQPLIMQSDGLFFRTESFFLIIQYFAPTVFSTTFLYRTLVRIAYKTDRRKKLYRNDCDTVFFFFVYSLLNLCSILCLLRFRRCRFFPPNTRRCLPNSPLTQSTRCCADTSQR